MHWKYLRRAAIFSAYTIISLSAGSCVYRWADDRLQVNDIGQGRIMDGGLSKAVGVVDGLLVGMGIWATWPLYRLIRKGDLKEDESRRD